MGMIHDFVPARPRRVAALIKVGLGVLAVLAIASIWNATKAQTVVDGDTLKLGGTTYRLWGIDAPEAKQTCRDDWPAGKIATEVLRVLVAGQIVTCSPMSIDRYGRTVAICFADTVNVNAAMVATGMAYAYVKYSHAYVDLEAKAVQAGLGVHAHACAKPWDWRAYPKLRGPAGAGAGA